MKELTIEEKAKRFDEVIEKLRKFYRDYDTVSHLIDVKEELANRFPELKESEDERIRKCLLSHFSRYREDEVFLNDILMKDIVSWLENQGGKQKLEGSFVNVDDVREDFVQEVYRVLDADSTNDRANQIIDAFDNLPTVIIENQRQTFTKKDVDDAYLKGVCDAKHELEKQGEQKPVEKIEPKFHEGDWIVHNTSGFRFKVESSGYAGYSVVSWVGFLLFISFDNEEKYHLWTIQDAKDGDVLATLDYILIFKKLLPKNGGVSYCHYDFGCSTPQFNFNKDNNWYFGKEAKVYPATQEQRDLLFQKMKEAGYKWDAEKKELKKIEQNPTDEEMKELLHTEYEKGRADAIAEMQNAWSEEDDVMLNSFLHKVEVCDLLTNKENVWIVKKLKSLRPQSHWKPSEEQMHYLYWIANIKLGDSVVEQEVSKHLNELYKDLKKLKE